VEPEIQYATLETCHAADDVVVVIDVMRAFSTAAYAFAAGAERILLTADVDEALALREQFPGALVMGEVGGKRVPGFDLWNSPHQIQNLDLRGKTLIQRTTAGTLGVSRCTAAASLFTASFVVAEATVRAVLRLQPRSVTFVATAVRPALGDDGRDDLACADYLSALLRAQNPDPQKYIAWRETFFEHRLQNVSEADRKVFIEDLKLCTQVNRFNFAMQVEKEGELSVLKKVCV